MKKLGLCLALIASLALAACGGRSAPAEGVREGAGSSDLASKAPAATAAPRPAAGLAGPAGPAGPAGAPARPLVVTQTEGSATTISLDAAQRQIIATGDVTIEVPAVQPVVAQVGAITQSLVGFVEQSSYFGDPERPQASMTIRIPQPQFSVALERLEALGKVLARSAGSQDVSEQFIDLEARLQSSLRQEKSLLSLLDKAQSVSDVLTIERELSRVRAEIERFQGQLNFLNRRVELATITIALLSPKPVGQPPSAFLTVAVGDVVGSVEGVKALILGLGGIVDRVAISTREGKAAAELSLRVLAPQFNRALQGIESQSKVTSKDVQEGRPPAGQEEARPQEPDARIEVSLVQKGSLWPWAWAGGLALAGALAVVGYMLGRRGRRRSE
ncbi:MAG: DUF4349 domain-containing protein [Dehalococcoidia bacterium]|nr:DUF4349 domain-containing protein [Dehalococcoidia bacterium]